MAAKGGKQTPQPIIPDGAQILAPLCGFCQHPLTPGALMEIATAEVTGSQPPLLVQVTTMSATSCVLCGVGHLVYLATSLRESRCVTAPFEASTVEEASRFYTADAVQVDDVLSTVDMMVGDGFSNMLSLWAKGKMGSPKKASPSKGSLNRRGTRRGGRTTGRPAL